MKAYELASLAGLSVNGPSLLMKARNGANMETLFNIAEVLGVDVWQLFSEHVPSSAFNEMECCYIKCPRCGVLLLMDVSEESKKCVLKINTYDGPLQVIGERIRNYMSVAGIKARELAEKVGIAPSNLSMIINGKTAPRIETLNLITNSLNVEAWQFLIVGQGES